MLNFGQQLYELTERDAVTPFIEPFYRQGIGTIGIGNTFSQTLLTDRVPRDRALYVHSVYLIGGFEAATAWRWLQFTAQLGSEQYFLAHVDGEGRAAGQSLQGVVPINLVLPPGVANLQFNVQRTGTTGAATYEARLISYLIPPGRINRA